MSFIEIIFRKEELYLAKKTEYTDKEKVYCTGCDKEKSPKDFYKSFGATTSCLLPFCKDCCYGKSLNGNK